MTKQEDMSIQLSSRVVRSEAIDFTRIDDTVVMMDVDKGRYYELDPVGTRVWALIEPGQRVGEVCEALVAEYEVAPAVCGDDVSAFLDRLLRLAVIGTRPGDDEIANDDSQGVAATPSGSARPPPAGIAVPRRRSEPRAKLAWSTPTIRTMAIARTEAGDEEQGDMETINQHVSYHPEEEAYS
jgi:hypothetical protein